MRSLRAITVLFVLMVLVPAGILGYLGWRSTELFSAQARRHAVAESQRRAVALRADVADQEQHILAGLRDEARRVAGEIRGALGRGRPLHCILVGVAPDYAVVDASGASLVPASRLRQEPTHLQEWAEFAARRQVADELEFRDGLPRAAGQRLLDLGGELATATLAARAFARSVMSFGRAGDAAGRSRALRSLLSLPRRVSIAASPMVVEALLLDRMGRERVRAAAAVGELLLSPATAAQRRSWARRLAGDASDVPPEDAGERFSFAVPLAAGVQLRRSLSLVELRQRLRQRLGAQLALTLEGFSLVDRGGVDLQPVVLSGRFGSHTVHLVNPALDRIAADTRVSRALTGLGILLLLAVMTLGMFLTRRALAREQAARRLREDFIGNVSHELRTPLTSIRLHTGMLVEPGLDAETRAAYGQVVEAEGARMAAMVEDLLDFAALERGRRQLAAAPIDLAAAATATTRAWESIAARDGVALSLVAPGEVVAMADATAVSRILANLVQNALKHGRPTGGEAPTIEIEVCPLDVAQVAVEVRDNGPGVVPAERGLVFEGFRQGKAAAGRGGAGLGLALSRQLARQMSGELELLGGNPARQGVGGATVFRLTLPGAPDIDPEPEPLEEA